MKRKNRNFAGQGTLEYLIILAAVVAFVLIIIGLITGFFDTQFGNAKTQNENFWARQAIGISDSGIDTNGDTFFIVTNNTNQTITLTGYSANGETKEFDPNGHLPGIEPGGSKIVYLGNQAPCLTATCELSSVSFKYRTGDGVSTFSNGNDLIVEQSPNVRRVEFSGSTLICANNDEVGLCTNATDTNWQTSWAVFDANMRATYALINSDTNIYTAQILSRDKNSLLIDLNGGLKSLFNFLDGNFTRNVRIDGNLVLNGIVKRTTCPTGYVLVPGDTNFGTSDFCVMKYEAQRDSQRRIVSVASGTPDSNVTLYIAKDNCLRAGGHLINMAEWMTIARNLEQQSINWQGGTVGTGCMYGGNLDGSNGVLSVGANDDSNYSGTGDSAGAAVCPFTAAPLGNASRRTMALSNGQIIWDFSGNLMEWIDTLCSYGGLNSDGLNYWDPTSSWTEWNNAKLADAEYYIAGPLRSLTSSNGIGKYQGCTALGNGALRGGNYGNLTNGGIYSLTMVILPTNRSDSYGYRCVKSLGSN